ncbi:odorant receptor 94b-like [Tribolium madens]|uniref:odorant receptor 94b-like n=1 Tax=Tribolium madens TaxID=41895 RepID=UPI001CF72EB9|nr:odorant receptor 94b-like [Tribolium madens]
MLETKQIVNHSFKLHVKVLTLIGLYPPKNHSILYSIYSIFLFLAVFVPVLVLGLPNFFFIEDVTSIDFSDFVTVGIIVYFFKIMPFLTSITKIQNCINYFDTFKYRVKSEEKIIEDCVGSCRRNTNVFLIGCCVSYLGFVAQVLLREEPEKLPLKLWLPFTNEEKPLFYYCIYCALLLAIGYATLACGVIDPMIGGLACHAAAQLQLLKRNLQYLDEYAEEKNTVQSNTGKKVHDVFYEEIIGCVHRYQQIVTFVNLFKNSFSQVVFSQLLGSVFVIGLCCLQIVKMKEIDVNFVITVNYFWVILFQIFFYCYYGTMLIEENYTLTNAIYMSKWYEYSIREQKTLIILMERSKKPMIITVGRILDLSLDTFTMVLRRSYSLLCSVLADVGLPLPVGVFGRFALQIPSPRCLEVWILHTPTGGALRYHCLIFTGVVALRLPRPHHTSSYTALMSPKRAKPVCSLLDLEPLSYEFLQAIIYMVCVVVQIYFYCYYGTILYEESNSLNDAVYMGNWYKYDVKSRKSLIILMERTKKPSIVSAGKVLHLSLVTFTTILQRSYSLLAVLKNQR